VDAGSTGREAARAETPAPLTLWLLRHGEAVAASPGGDAARPLSARGERTVTDLGEELAARGFRPARVYASPLLRARDTARLLLARVAPALTAETLSELAPDVAPQELVAALRAHGALAGDVLLVGHQPLLGMLAALLVGGEEPGFTPATLVGIAFRDGLVPGAGRIVATRRPAPA
jgi:phosphohistidine phosphatase